MGVLILDNEKIYLREISFSDTDNIIKWRNSLYVKQNFIYQKDLTREEHESWIKTKVKCGKVKQFIIIEKGNNNPIGSVYLRDIDYNNSKAEFGIFIGEKTALNKGYGTIATNMITKYGFNQLGLNKIFLRVFENNVHAIRSYEKSNFIQEGLFKQDVCIDKKFYNIIFMSIFKNGDSND
ncbi:UDP-4-amino-4,6-dideoxy-N-acetyl-beta-L-altrosamine N-acetyltransferase [Clostridium aciditolerans]|uniref:UDP-4-amino-4, 6-dideoxy-N-acetyl-beta-L-altrosamine N-acetyltransferase n=1 Tax=Clostridium aciditolerans TaxID=339861 RepID=A0A934I053_9CLOT|nr:UDP-4-amino-4,6-dideoxy-N-acetyl-beta-L-altrosamine N-acetyltransferase [Clostridium aciditolerans]MBI6873595.1 UDP-4-amino-4,6-dideoxy-N-acetyl-beta-L-altrosamine N-acetyltransferase [Clostridium aciditolerans]